MWEVDSEVNSGSIFSKQVLNSVKHVLNLVKQVLNLVKHVLNSVKQVLKHGPWRLLTARLSITVYNQPGTCITAVFYTPRFSYSISETVICTCSRGTTSACTTGYCTGGLGRVYRTGVWVGGYTGWVIRGPTGTMESGGNDSEAGPVGPQGRSGWSLLQRPHGHPPHPLHTPAGCSGARFAGWALKCRLWANKDEIHDILLKS